MATHSSVLFLPGKFHGAWWAIQSTGITKESDMTKQQQNTFLPEKRLKGGVDLHRHLAQQDMLSKGVYILCLPVLIQGSQHQKRETQQQF